MGQSFARGVCFVLLIVSVAGAVRAGDPTKSPDEIFKDKGLVKSGFLLVLPDEKTLHEAVAALHAAKAKLAAQASSFKDADTLIKTAEDALKKDEDELRDIDQKMANGQADNIMIGRHNLLLDQIKDRNAKIKSLTDTKEKILASKGDYITTVLDAVGKADAASHAYDALHDDKELAAVIEKYNLTAKPKAKLGPSAYFTEDLAFVNQCRADVTSDSLSITTESGIPHVDVLVNGQPVKMVWDSGCTGVTLSAKTARALGLWATADDELETAVIADGSEVTEHVKILDSIRIGAFTIKHVRCTIPSGSAAGTDLLGNEFQHLFQFKLDINKKTLQLSPLDSQAVTIEAPSKNSPRPRVAAGPAPGTGDAPAPADADPVDPGPAGSVARAGKTITVKYGSGDTELATLKEGVKYFSNRDYPLQSLPDELDGLMFTRREAGKPSDVDITLPAGVTVYVLIDSDKSGVHDTAPLNDQFEKLGWTRLDDAECMIEGKHPFIAIYKKTDARNIRCTIPSRTWAGVVVAAKKLAVDAANTNAPDDAADQPAKAETKNPANSLVGVWVLSGTGSATTLNADGTAKSADGVKGTWTTNTDGSVVEIKWADGSSDTYRLRNGKWTRYACEDGTLQSKNEITPP